MTTGRDPGSVGPVSPGRTDASASAGSGTGTTPGSGLVPDAARSAARSAFLARVTAGATHELRNVLAIVKESAGLVGDLVDAAGRGRTPDPSKIDWALDRIRLQVARGAELSTALNRVMHGLDEPEGRVELEPAVEHAVLLARRFARRHECEIEHVPGADLAVTCSALDLSMALVGLLEWCAERLPPSSTVAVRVESTDDGPAVRFDPEPAGVTFGDVEPEPGRRLNDLMAWIPATIHEPGGTTLILRFSRSGAGPDEETP